MHGLITRSKHSVTENNTNELLLALVANQSRFSFTHVSEIVGLTRNHYKIFHIFRLYVYVAKRRRVSEKYSLCPNVTKELTGQQRSNRLRLVIVNTLINANHDSPFGRQLQNVDCRNGKIEPELLSDPYDGSLGNFAEAMGYQLVIM